MGVISEIILCWCGSEVSQGGGGAGGDQAAGKVLRLGEAEVSCGRGSRLEPDPRWRPGASIRYFCCHAATARQPEH